MKIKYLRLSKEERKDARNRYYNTPKGNSNKKRLTRSLICAILCILFSFYLLYDAFFNTKELFDKVYGFGILVLGIIMIFMFMKLRIKLINSFITVDEVKNNKKKK